MGFYLDILANFTEQGREKVPDTIVFAKQIPLSYTKGRGWQRIDLHTSSGLANPLVADCNAGVMSPWIVACSMSGPALHWVQRWATSLRPCLWPASLSLTGPVEEMRQWPLFSNSLPLSFLVFYTLFTSWHEVTLRMYCWCMRCSYRLWGSILLWGFNFQISNFYLSLAMTTFFIYVIVNYKTTATSFVLFNGRNEVVYDDRTAPWQFCKVN